MGKLILILITENTLKYSNKEGDNIAVIKSVKGSERRSWA